MGSVSQWRRRLNNNSMTMKKWYRTIKIDIEDCDPDAEHYAQNISGEQCEILSETDDGCPACQQAYDDASDLANRKLEEKGLEVWDIMHTNRTGCNMEDDLFWEFEVCVYRVI